MGVGLLAHPRARCKLVIPTLNIDLGELPDEPEELYALADVVNVACGGHAGDDASIARAVELARAGGATVAAHPSYPDREGFGRRMIAIAPEDLAASVREQLARVARHVPITIVKPHGALYHDLGKSYALANAFYQALATFGAPAIVGPPGSPIALAPLPFVAEGFADRGYAADGSLLPRGTGGALIDDPARAADAARALMARGDIATICVHSDTPNAVAIARAVREVLR
jgi:5-oxoprolinase (ATP-hydrolysing) subunit A